MRVWIVSIKIDGDDEDQVAVYGHKPIEEELRGEVLGYLGRPEGEEPEMRFKEDEYGMHLYWDRYEVSWAHAPKEGMVVTP